MGERVTNRWIFLFLLAALAVVAQVFVFGHPAQAQARGGWMEKPDATWATNGTVYDTALSEDGKTLYVGGKFTLVREKPPNEVGGKFAAGNLAAIDVSTGAVVRTWKPKVTAESGAVVRAVEVSGDRVYVGGSFTAVNGSPRLNLAAVDTASGATDPNLAPVVETADPTVRATVFTILVGDSKVYAGGDFSYVNGRYRGKLAAFDSATGAMDVAWDPAASREVFDLEFASDRQTIFAIGRFRSIVGADGVQEVRETVGRLDTATGNVDPWALPAGIVENPQTAWEALVTPTRLYAGFGDKGPNYVASFRLDDGNVGTRLWKYNTVGDVYALAMTPDGSRLFFGGHFGINRLRQTACGEPLQGLASLDPSSGRIRCDWLPQLQPEFSNGNGPWDMALIGGGQLWTGGGFTHVSGVNQTNLARFSYDPNYRPGNRAPKVDLDGPQRGGLDATFFDNVDFTGAQVSRTDATVNYDFGSGSPASGIGADTFSGRWTGQIEAPVSGQYTFTTRSDDGVRLFVEGEPVIDNWTDHGATNNSGSITLEAGRRYDVALDHYDNSGGSTIRLSWAYPGQATQIVPSGSLFYAGSTSHSATLAGNGPTPIVSGNLAVTDADDLTLRSASIALANSPDGAAEALSADTTGTGIVANYDPQTGVLSLDGAAPKADYQRVLRTVAYANGAASPTAGDRNVAFVVNDGYAASAAATSTVRVQAAP